MRNLFESERLSVEQSIQLTVESLQAYGERYRHWAIAYSGGKDSSGLVTLIAWLIATERIAAPESLIVLYADTRMEIPPLQMSAMRILAELQERGIRTQVVMPALDDRFFVYLFGRGVPPPSNTFRWCTPQLKIEPMQCALEARACEMGFGEMVHDEKKEERHFKATSEQKDFYRYRGFGKDKLLTLTGVRLGESAARDQRIAMSCSRDGAECGQGWLQQSPRENLNDTLAPILHWRVCHVWDWLKGFVEDHGFSTGTIAEVYGVYDDGSDAENGTRTGCVGCNLASRDTALDNLLKIPAWRYLAPLKRLKPLYAELKRPVHRLRKGMERKADGSLVANPGRMGPLTMDGRRLGLQAVLDIQGEINKSVQAQGRPEISLINDLELTRIHQLIEANTWPNRWDGTENRADEWTDQIYRGGLIQPVMIFE